MLEFSWPAFVFAIVNFLILTGLLYKFLHQPLLNVLEKRRREIEASQEKADEKARKAEEKRQEYEEKMGQIQQERDRLLSQAREKTENAREEVLEKAHEEAERDVKNRKAAFERERRDALTDLQHDIIDLCVETARRVLEKAVDAELEEKLNRSLLEELQEMAEQQEEGKEMQAPDTDAPSVALTSASPLSEELQTQFLEALGKLGYDRDNIDVKVDDSLVAGTRIEFSDRALDGSLRDVLESVRERSKELSVEEQKAESGGKKEDAESEERRAESGGKKADVKSEEQGKHHGDGEQEQPSGGESKA